MKVNKLTVAILQRLNREKNRAMCSCNYKVRADRYAIWCRKCRAYQKHAKYTEKQLSNFQI